MSLSSPISHWDTLEHPLTWTCTNSHAHRCQWPQSNRTRFCFFATTFYSPFSILQFGCMQEFAVKDFCFDSLCVCVLVRAVPEALISLSLSLSFRFGARSTGSRRGEKRLIFQYVILYFLVNKCVFPYSLVCVSKRTGASDSIFLTKKNPNPNPKKNHHSSNANES